MIWLHLANLKEGWELKILSLGSQEILVMPDKGWLVHDPKR